MTELKKTFRERAFSLVVGFSLFLAATGVFIGHTIKPAYSQLAGAQTWLGTAGGTANAITLTIHNVAALSDLIGVSFRFLPASTNSGPTTITVNLDNSSTLGPVTVQRPTSNLGLQGLSGNDFIGAQIAEVVYDGTVFEIKHAIDMTPIGHSVEFRGTTAPAGTLVEDGSCYSQTTYAALFSVVGTTYNAGAPVACTGAQFAVPDSRGSLFAALDTQGANGAANRLTSGGSGCTATSVAFRCGAQNNTLITANLPPYTPSGTVASTSGGFYSSGNVGASSGSFNFSAGLVTPAFSFTGNAQGGTSTPFTNVPPVLGGIRAIKY
jgi:microcystin-dependent protein